MQGREVESAILRRVYDRGRMWPCGAGTSVPADRASDDEDDSSGDLGSHTSEGSGVQAHLA